tara:strand:+ start:412 stop:606 length:195 start_codon:yes stop_codon:yes gene_type:complete
MSQPDHRKESEVFQRSTSFRQSSFLQEGRARYAAFFLIELAATCAFFGGLYAATTFITVATGNL